AAPEFFVDVNADFNSAAIGAAREKFTEAEPASNGTVQFCNPDRVLRRGMRVEPFATALNCDRFQLRGGSPRSYGSIMNFNNRGKIGFDGIAESNSRSRGHRPRPVDFFLNCRGHRLRLQR